MGWLLAPVKKNELKAHLALQTAFLGLRSCVLTDVGWIEGIGTY